MEFIRCELHNQTIESDGQLTVANLADLAEEKNYEVLALTDHNTVSGHTKLENYLNSNNYQTQLIKGVEMTTNYGHVLGLGMETVSDFNEFNPYNPSLFFENMRQAGAQAIGLAHPYCPGRPLMTGCRFEMDIKDYNAIDYIEVFNTSAGASDQANRYVGNYQALEWWEELVLAGNNLAATSGKDIHGYPVDEQVFITYAYTKESFTNKSQQVIEAILNQETFVTRGPRVEAHLNKKLLQLNFDHNSDYYNWSKKYQDTEIVVEVIYPGVNEFFELDFSKSTYNLTLESKPERVVIRIYEDEINEAKLLLAGLLVKNEER